MPLFNKINDRCIWTIKVIILETDELWAIILFSISQQEVHTGYWSSSERNLVWTFEI